MRNTGKSKLIRIKEDLYVYLTTQAKGFETISETLSRLLNTKRPKYKQIKELQK